MTVHRPIDVNGWRIPREGTKSYHIYQLLLLGYKSGEICRLYHMEIESSIRVLAHNIKNPVRHNNSSKTWRIKHREIYNAIQRRSTAKKAATRSEIKKEARTEINELANYVRKLKQVLNISYDEAVKLATEEMEKARAKVKT